MTPDLRENNLIQILSIKPLPSGGKKVRLAIDPTRTAWPIKTGFALDASGSMARYFAPTGTKGSVFGSFFGKRSVPQANLITPIAQQIAAFLAGQVDSQGSTHCVYWSTGPGGKQIETIGDFTAESAQQHFFAPPRQFGTGSHLLPAVQYFQSLVPRDSLGQFVIVTDGDIHDMEPLRERTRILTQEIIARRRLPLTLVLLGLGEAVNCKQLEQLEIWGEEARLWLCGHAVGVNEVMPALRPLLQRATGATIVDRVLDAGENLLADYSKEGFPSNCELEMADGNPYLLLELSDGTRSRIWLQDDTIDSSSRIIPERTKSPESPAKLEQSSEWDEQFLAAIAGRLQAAS